MATKRSLVVLLASSWTFASANAADFQVQRSNVASIPVGRTFAKGSKLKLPNGALLSLNVKTDDGLITRTCVGPYTGTIDACPTTEQKTARSCSWLARVFGWCSPSEKYTAGGTRKLE